MAGSQKVQEYLQQHKIGNMFEDLMAKVVSDMPDDPVLYMIQTLERKATRMGSKALMRRSMGDLANLKSPDKAATWAGGVSVAKERPYTKPWQTNTKRQKNKTDAAPRRPRTAGAAGERPGWDKTVKGANTNLDDFWGEGDVLPPGRGSSPTRTVSRKAAAWTDETEDEELLYRSQGYEGPRRLYESDADPLSGEFSLVREKPPATRRETTHGTSSRVSKQRADAEKHRQQLARLVQDKQRQADSGIEDDRDIDTDDALELLENADDLMSEGVTKVRRSGVKVRPASRGRADSGEPQVRVSICARCAKVMNGAQPSEPAEGTRYGELPNFNYDTDRELDSRPQSSARQSPGLSDDDEFESVSQVSGPRRPVWQNTDSDTETASTKKGRHMFTSSGIPSKGRPMFSPKPADRPKKSSMRATMDVFQSTDTTTSAGSLKGHGAFNRTWTEGMGISDDEGKKKALDKEKVEEKQEEDDLLTQYSTGYLYVSKSYDAQIYQDTPEKEVTFRTPDAASTARDKDDDDDDDDGRSSAVSLQGAGWAAAPNTDYDSDFSVPPNRVSRARGTRQYQGQY